jgi:hypothetical protein
METHCVDEPGPVHGMTLTEPLQPSCSHDTGPTDADMAERDDAEKGVEKRKWRKNSRTISLVAVYFVVQKAALKSLSFPNFRKMDISVVFYTYLIGAQTQDRRF